jgi:hypothetical protein
MSNARFENEGFLAGEYGLIKKSRRHVTTCDCLAAVKRSSTLLGNFVIPRRLKEDRNLRPAALNTLGITKVFSFFLSFFQLLRTLSPDDVVSFFHGPHIRSITFGVSESFRPTPYPLCRVCRPYRLTSPAVQIMSFGSERLFARFVPNMHYDIHYLVRMRPTRVRGSTPTTHALGLQETS